jgi:lipoate---protein ligase
MKYLDLTFDDPASNLACDEALLELFETAQREDSLLRFWESKTHFIVLGHSNRWRAEVNPTACQTEEIAVLRRMSGGGAVVQGPGCLNYSLILNIAACRLKSIGDAFHYVLERHRAFIAEIAGVEVRVDGISDLTVSGRKFSGNAQYRKARFVLVHGTFLLNFDLSLIEKFLRVPARQPRYRRDRPHPEFVANLNIALGPVRDSLREGWVADEALLPVPLTRIESLVNERYGRETWSRKF